MKYRKANTVLPDSLVKEIQKYVCGEMLYIPSPEGSHKSWGENSGTRTYLQLRNKQIKLKFQEGICIDQLVDEYCLSYDSIKKIVYSSTTFTNN